MDGVLAVLPLGLRSPRHLVLLLGICPWWPQQLVLGCWLGLAFGRVIHSHQIPLRIPHRQWAVALIELHRRCFQQGYPHSVDNSPRTYSKSGATMSISSRQCFGGGGSSSGAITMRNSTPHTLQRYRTLILRISPDGGGGGMLVVIDFNMPKPNFHVTRKINTPTAHHTKVPHAGHESASELITKMLTRGVR